MALDRVKHFSIILVGEFIATTFLLYFGCMGIFDSTERTHWALAWGTALVAVVMVGGHITGAHCNPCVSLAAFINGLIGVVDLFFYVIAQFIGASFGFFLAHVSVRGIEKMRAYDETGFCVVNFNNGVTIWQGMLAEFIATSILVYACLSMWDPRNAKWGDSVAVKIGLLLASLVYSIGDLTGACLNPARAFGPALINNRWEHLWCYFASPLLASLLTTIFYQYMYLDGVHRARRQRKTPVIVEDPLLYDRKMSTADLADKSNSLIRISPIANTIHSPFIQTTLNVNNVESKREHTATVHHT